MIQIFELIGGAYQDAPEPFHAGQKFIGLTRFPGTDSPFAAKKEGIGFINNQDGVFALGLFKGQPDVFFRFADIFIKNIAESFAYNKIKEGAADD